MNQLISSKKIIRLSIICIILLFVPVVLFIMNFNSQSISNDIDDWSSFGGYISGVTNTIISGISLIVLAYLTYFVGKNSSIENKNVNILMRKLDAYEKLSSYLPTLALSLESMIWHLSGIVKYFNDQSNQMVFEEYLEKFYHSIHNVKEVHYFLLSFGERYEHLFRYDFKSSDYKQLCEASTKVVDDYDKFLSKFDKGEMPELGLDNKIIIEFTNLLDKFVLVLKSELR